MTVLADLTEKAWMAQVVELAKTLGWRRIYHTHDSRRSSHGFPDLVLVRDRVVWLEVKTERGKLTEHQKGWLIDLLAAGQDAFVARPSDWDVLGRVLAVRLTAGRGTSYERLRGRTFEECG